MDQRTHADSAAVKGGEAEPGIASCGQSNRNGDDAAQGMIPGPCSRVNDTSYFYGGKIIRTRASLINFIRCNLSPEPRGYELQRPRCQILAEWNLPRGRV